ncbi:unnamed protein product [Nesidiocoris tenuis]|uniref:Bridge-like lipid transfer protein family member 1 C-terminal domain-containing protein n=1 Tax=Nesidiocoris tenuis TaxID=355587 RepID=A0A6H5HJ57_9HEMI|nr:unnamed protein product [Nesidiocoris tenuis]
MDHSMEMAFPEASPWNSTLERTLDSLDITMDSNFALLLCSLVSAIAWIIYITYYNARVVGYIVTKILNRVYVTDGYLKVGSLTLCALSGKIMFRDFVYITHDYSLRVQDGWIIFRWWRAYVPKDVSEDLSHSDTRLSVMLNGFELHVYNRSDVYSQLERVFGLDPLIIPNSESKGGIVPAEPLMLELANGDVVESSPPQWGMDVKCGRGTDFSYGPWADRQREHLFKFFYPQDYQPLKVTKPPQPGEKRTVQSFDIRLSTLYDATIDILFSKNRETNAVHVNIGPGSYLEVTMPWVVGNDGYCTKVTGQLLHLEATTSLQYRSLLESETLEFGLRAKYPIKWNDHQEWILNLTGCKATVWFIYAHKEFFQAMINDWASKARPDILHFIPYTWRFSLLMKEFEFIMPANEYNWIDCSSQSHENMYMAFCGELFDFSFDLPFNDFLPPNILLKFWIQGESMDLALYLPEVFSSRNILLSLDQTAKLLGRDGNLMGPRTTDSNRKWRNICKRKDGWLDCWSVPIVALSINYVYHFMPMFGPPPQADITTPEKEEILLSPMRMPHSRKRPLMRNWKQDGPRFDPTTLPPDKVSLDLEIGPSVLLIYGAWIKGFVNLKENIFGDDQVFTDMNETPEFNLTPKPHSAVPETPNSVMEDASKEDFDPRIYRPLEVIVSITMHDIQAHLVKNCTEKDPPCPIILLERFGFEMKKTYKETLLQLLLSPAILLSSDKLSSRPSKEKHLNQGHLMLSGFQLRGHAMFSDEGRTLDQETMEYAWLLELQLGKLSGKMTTPQMYNLMSTLEALFLLTIDSENRLLPPKAPPPCHHGLVPVQCPESEPSGTYRCPPPDSIKYRMVRVAVDALDLYILESGTAIHLLVAPIRFSTCNLHGNQVKSGLTGVIPLVKLRQMIVTNHLSATNTTGSGRSQYKSNNEPDIWLEVGSISLGPLIIEAAVSLSNTDHNLHLVQHRFLKTHDERYRRLWLLWPGEKTGRCGCIGGCSFFGSNLNGPKFFRPSRQDATDGLNIAQFRINEKGKDPGFGQSILHDDQLVFHTPPYNSNDVNIYDSVGTWSESSATKPHIPFKTNCTIDPSESEHSLQEQLVQRTVSMCSENQSEAFFSAEEDLSQGLIPVGSRSASLRHSVTLSRQDSLLNKKPFGSDMSIVGNMPQQTAATQASRLCSHRSDHEIHTPQHRTEQDGITVLLDSSDTHSISSTSFISAVSSQEDLTLVNLHMQVNKPIVDSPLLMSSYVNHLSQVTCLNWAYSSFPTGSDAFTVPLFQKTDDGRLVYVGRFVDALTPTLSSLHPLTVVNSLDLSCMGRVEASNVLKRDQYLSQLQGGGSKRSTAEREGKVKGQPHCVIEQCIATQIQATVILPKINFALLQASVVEEVISFSALDNVRDLTCVSLLAVSFENLNASFHCGKQTRETVETFERPAMLPSAKKSGFKTGKALLLGFRTSTAKHDLAGEPVYIETSQKQQEETVITLNISKIHAQLRRLHNDCSLLKDAEITAIPSHCSKVMFNTRLITKQSHEEGAIRYQGVEDLSLVGLSEEKLGFIMFECGLEGVSFKSRYGRFTPLSKTLQEDPSCQLCCVLRRYILQTPVNVEDLLKESDLPHLSTLRQGVIVLSRQWKNVLYTPMLLEHNFKTRHNIVKPLNVTFAVPDAEDVSLHSLERNTSPQREASEDLYTWMAKQQEFTESKKEKVEEKKAANNAAQSKGGIGGAPPVGNPDYLLLSSGYSLYPMHDSLRLLDAHLIFEPLLSSLGVMPTQMISNSGTRTNTLESWGSNLSLIGGVESMRIDIVVSEHGKMSDKKEKLWLEMPPETPAFVCEKLNLELELCRLADMTVVEDLSRQRRNVLYVSRGQLKKHSSTVLNVSIAIRYISQQVNMPLLRLLLQISNMYQNVKETQSELKEQQPTENKLSAKTPPAHLSRLDLRESVTTPIIEIEKPKPFQRPKLVDGRPVVSPSSSIRAQSLANRLRSTGKSVRDITSERTRLIVFAVAKIHRTRLLATLSGLKLEAEMTNLHSSLTVRKKTRPSAMECSLTGHVGRTMIVLLEGVPPNQQTVVKVMIGKSQALFSSINIPGKDKNSALLTVGSVAITIPQHPVALHGMMARGSKHLSFTLQSLSITAALLPSLQAQYRMEQVTSSGVTASKVKFVIDLPRHSLSFSTKVQVTEANLPSEASIELPQVHVSAEYIQDGSNALEGQFGDGVVLRHGNYLNAMADIGVFEHSLTTDLLNHLVFVQKVFMKEVNEVVQKVYGGEKPVPLWEDDLQNEAKITRMLFSLGIRLKRIQLTAVTPTNCAVRLETGSVDLQLSNRVQNVSGPVPSNTNMKLFIKATVDVNLSLGQVIKHAIFEEADAEFQQFAFFKTRIGLRNAFQGEMIGTGNEGKEVILISLRRPLIYIQPMAVDKAILVWLNYKNAYEYWNEQRSSLNKEVLTATQQVFEKMPFEKLTGPPILGTLFLQLTVEDMGICIPLNPLPPPNWGRHVFADDSCAAVVLTLESTSISACSWGSLVCKGRFVGLCLRFADDFETSLDDWKPDSSETAMNLCVVSEGTYEVCSRTVAAQKIDSGIRRNLITLNYHKLLGHLKTSSASFAENAKWFLNVQWAMQGVDIHLDINIGKQLSALGHTLTTLTSYQEDDVPNRSYDSDDADNVDIAENSAESPLLKKSRANCDSLPFLDPSLDAKNRSKLIEKELNEQAKIINDLRTLGASQSTIEQEMKRLRELEALVFKDFRRSLLLGDIESSTTGSSPSTAPAQQKPTEPNIDFELDVKVLINRGKCVLHTKDQIKEDELKILTRMKKERSCSGGMFEFPPPSPSLGRKTHSRHHSSTPGNRLRQHQAPPLGDVTVFHIPGLDVKVHYESKTAPETPTREKRTVGTGGVKKAALFAWATLQSIPEETVISPHILEFLEQTLEPIPTNDSRSSPSAQGGMFASNGNMANNTVQYYASFPVDVIVYFHMQPSTFRFSCLPVSRVECMLQLPSLDTVFSSKRADPSLPTTGPGAMGGISVTTCLSDFSLYIFHPYGGKKSGNAKLLRFRTVINSVKEPQWSPLSDSERKDSLSVNVEFVKFHLSRSRKVNTESKNSDQSAIIRFSTIADIGSASFKYDMRRLTEILAFPKAWYRRSIMRRLFLGDLSGSTTYSDGDESDTGYRWQIKVFRSEGRLAIGSSGHKNMYIGLGLDGASLDAKGGIVGGTIDLSNIDTFITIREDPGIEPSHTVGLKLGALECRLDYMGTAVLMGRVSKLEVQLKDEWKTEATDSGAFCPTRRPAMIFMHGDLGWDQLQVMMSKSTTVDLFKMYYKLEEFFTQQFKSSKRVFSSLGNEGTRPDNSFRKRPARKKISMTESMAGWAQEARHHRHWQRALGQATILNLVSNSDNSAVLGGTLDLHGTNISLACFHGINFKSKSWALFSLKEPMISFATEAQRVPNSESSQIDSHIIQTLTFSLGMAQQGTAQHDSMATVCKVSRNVVFPPQFRTLQEWFHYAFSCSEEDAVDRFPCVERDADRVEQTSRVRSAPKTPDAKHTREVIFALPSLQTHLKTEHLQAPLTPNVANAEDRPVVQCSFVTEFEDHIFVTVDAEAFFFLHDLITSYLREKERVMGYGQVVRAQSPLPDNLKAESSVSDTASGGSDTGEDDRGKKRSNFDPTDVFNLDWRTFHCKTWHLEPTVRLLSWGGKRIEPYGVDYILQKLGFSHARTTIPKWVQRGFMDPLDKVLSVLAYRMLQVASEQVSRNKR